MIFVLFEVVVWTALAAFIINQVIVPLWHGTPLFPFLSRKKAQVESEIVQAREDVEVAEAETLLESLRSEAKAFK
jgi:F0F1-type ATP synthase membrane subunit b/b'